MADNAVVCLYGFSSRLGGRGEGVGVERGGNGLEKEMEGGGGEKVCDEGRKRERWGFEEGVKRGGIGGKGEGKEQRKREDGYIPSLHISLF